MIIDHPPQDADLLADAQRTAAIMQRVRQVPAYGSAVAERRPVTTRQAARQAARHADRQAGASRRWWPVLALLLVLAVTLLSDAFGPAIGGAPEVGAISAESPDWAPLLGDALLAAVAALGLAVVIGRRSAP